ncbi:Alpha/Beta hydrolase protein, partial [Mycena capillaripes]
IPYATPPVGTLRFKVPRPLPPQNSTVQDVSEDFDGDITACVQFGTASFVGVNAGPGVEDCLKLWIWAPASTKEGDNLAVQLYSNGGEYQNSQSSNNDFSDWVGQDEKFIAVNANYRLGQLGFWNSQGSLNEGEANVGLLDGRFAVEWVVKHISK